MLSEPKKPQVHGIFHKGMSTVTYVVTDPTRMVTVILDSVLDYDAASSRTSNEHNDNVVEYCRANSLDVRYILETHVHGTFGVGSAVPTTSMCRQFGQSHMWLVCTGVLTIL